MRAGRARSLVVPLVMFALGCGAESGPPQPDTLAQLFSGELRMIDLTHAVDGMSPFWPNAEDRNPFVHDTLAAHADGSPSMAAYSTPEHHGTHLDAPVHFAQGQPSVDELTASDLFGPAVVVDIREQSARDEDYLLTVADLEAWETSHGRIPDRAIVLLRTGWADRWSDVAAYQNRGEDGRLHFPGFSPEAGLFLVDTRNIRGIGIDNPSVDPGISPDYPAHGVVNGAGRFHLENLASLSEVPATGAWLIVAPIKIRGGSGGQVRVWAVLP